MPPDCRARMEAESCNVTFFPLRKTCPFDLENLDDAMKMPGEIRRQRRPLFIAICGAMIVLLIGDVLPITQSGKAVKVASLIVMTVCLGQYVQGIRRIRRLKKDNYEVCLNCGYLLHGLPDNWRCPECGAGFDKKLLKENWLKWS